MAVLPTGIGPVTGGYQIERSLRFNSADTAYLSRTPASASNRKTWTWSGWVKRSTLSGTRQGIFNASNALANAYWGLEFDASEKLNIYDINSAGVLTTAAVYRDISAWYHIVVALDTTQATASNRVKLYVNGIQVTTFSATNYPPLNADSNVNSTLAHSIGSWVPASTLYFNGYMTEVNFIDGQALTPSSFGETDSATGVWKPKAFSGTYGTNGFYLKFADNSNTTAATLGKDSSGNGNNWTPNNFSVTAGVNNDSMVDTPTAYGTDTGAGGEVRGNYCTMNPLNTYSSITLSNGNLQLALTEAAYRKSVATMAFPSSGLYYLEGTVSGGIDYVSFGIVTPTAPLSDAVGATATGYGVVTGTTNWDRRNNGSTSGNFWTISTSNPTLQIAYNATSGKLWLGYNNTWLDSSGGVTGNPSAGTNETFTVDTTRTYLPSFGGYKSNSIVINLNCGQRPFAYTAPSGFKALCTQNLPTPTIGATSTTQANDYFDIVTWAGNNVTPRTISGLDFQPDFVWLKDRTVAHYHYLYDAVRGAGNNSELSSNLTAVEGGSGASEYGYVSAFTSNGFTLTGGTDPTYYMSDVNYPGSNFVGWNWKANGAGSTNSNGTAKSSSVTVDSSTDTVTWNSHGMSDGQKIGFFAATMPGGLSAGTLYYVRDAATNTFKVATSSGGAAIDITSNGTTVTAHTTLTSTVSANTTAGFSIVKHINSGAPATIEHGLGVAPKFIINKVYDRTENWRVYYGTSNKLMQLNTTSAEATDTNVWNNTNPTSNVFSIGTYWSSGDDVISYCFTPVAGYSAFGSYTGNGSTDGVFVYTGFRPRWILIKNASAAEPWNLVDTSRDPYNVMANYLQPNSSGAEGSITFLDGLSNGFKLRSSAAAFNGSGNTMIYACFAETPAKFSLAR